MCEWKETTLSEIATYTTGKLNSNAEVENGVYPFFTCSPITLQIDNYAFDTEALILAGNNANGVFSLKYFNGKFNAYQRTYIISIKNLKKNDYKFLYYALKLQLSNLEVISHGTATKYLTLPLLNQIPVSSPPLPEQRAIASILSSLDDKITLLHRQNQTLEAMAETLFRQWFVEEADAGWGEGSLLELIQLIGGGTPKTAIVEYWDGDIPWLAGGDIATNHKSFVNYAEKRITEVGLNNSSAKLLPKYATVISARGTVGKYCLLSEPMAFSQSNYGILPNIKDCFFFTYMLINHVVEELLSSAYGSVFDTITTTTFKENKVPIPTEMEIVQFEKSISSYFQKMFMNKGQISTLEKLRDTLLPKLMSGEVRVEV